MMKLKPNEPTSKSQVTTRALLENQNKKAREMSRMVISQLRKQNAQTTIRGRRVGRPKKAA